MRRLPLIIAFSLLAFGITGWLWSCTRHRPNIVLISIDTLRADHLSVYGYDRPTSPNIDRLAREGTLFTAAYASSSWTVPSHMTMFTSLPSSLHGVDNIGKSLDPARVTLAERLRDSGYRTAAFVSGPTLHRAFGFDEGFELYENLSGSSEEDYAGDPLRPSQAWWKSHQAITGPVVSKAVIQWLEGADDSPFFLFIHLWDPHHDYIPPAPYDTLFDEEYRGNFDFSGLPFKLEKIATMSDADKRHLVALYDGEITATDAVVGQLIDALERLHLLDNSLIVLTSDHGEEFFEHRQTGHEATLYEEVVHVPLIFRLTGRVEAGQKIEAIFDAIHLMPTILGVVGIEAGPEARGRNLAEVLRGEKPPEDLRAFMRLALIRKVPIYAIRIGNRKYHSRVDAWSPLRYGLYYFDLQADPREKSPIAKLDDAATRVFEQFASTLERHEAYAKALPREGGRRAPLDEKTKEQLRSLGYIR